MDISKNNLLIIKDDSKRNRKSNAVKLPPEINECMIPKYVVYYKECYNKEKMLFREFFKIEKHPKVKNNRVFTSSKSNKIGILDKLEQIKSILLKIDEIDETGYTEETEETDETEETEETNIEKINLPKYISLKKTENDRFYLNYDKKLGETRQTYKCYCDTEISITENLKKFIEKINEKFIKTT